MFDIASKETYDDGQIIFEEGSSGSWMYVVLSGNVEISKAIDGKKVVIQTLEKEEVFGELVFLGDVSRTATARAVGKTTVGIVEHEFLTQEFNKLSPKFRYILMGIVKKLKRTTDVTCRFLAEK
jgi:CRP/FNR family cyclic AMP-dependent transcriptional regulator